MNASPEKRSPGLQAAGSSNVGTSNTTNHGENSAAVNSAAVPAARYFGGSPTRMGRIRALPYTSFNELVTLGIEPVPILYTRAQFFALPSKEQARAKAVDFLVPATFASPDSPRQSPLALNCNLLFIDIDDGNEAQRLLDAGFDKLLGDLGTAVWKTASSTPDAPRLRVMVRGNAIPPAQYGAAVESLSMLLGMSSVTSESKVPVQAMYLPVEFKGEPPPQLVYAKPDGRAFDPGTSVALTASPAPAVDPGIGDIEHLRAPMDGVTKEEIVDALNALDPDCSRPEWLAHGMGIKHQRPKDGFDVWNNWSLGGKKYPGLKAIKKEWSSFVGQPKHRTPVTIRSVLRAAMTAGWFPSNPTWLTHRSFVEECARNDQRGDAELLAVLAKGQFLFDHTSKQWRIFRHGIWESDEVRHVRALTKPLLAKTYTTLAGKLHAELTDDLNAGRIDGKNLKQDPREKLRALLLSKVARLNRRSHLDDVLNLAGDFLAAKTSDFDRQPFLLNLLNGTLDLRTGHFRRHDPRDRLSKRALVEYDPKAVCPDWLAFLHIIFKGDAAKIEFFRRAAGYLLSGEVDHDFIVFCHGIGSNGKTTALEVIRKILGDYFVQLPIEALLAQSRGQRDSQATAELARLHGARFALSSEIPEGRRLNESLVKDITGGDEITARMLYGHPFTFSPTHKLWLMGNHKPDIRGVDDGIWRRIYLLPFEHQFPKSGPGYRERTTVVGELMAEKPGILNWLLEGYNDLRKNGLNPPDSVKAATADYRDDSDTLGDFIRDACIVDPTASCTSANVWDAYTTYCGAEKRGYSSKKSLTTALEKRGYRRNRSNSARRIEGLELLENVM